MLIRDLLPDLLPYVMACPDPVAVRALRESARRFCRETQVIVKIVDFEVVVLGQESIQFADYADENAEVIAPVAVIVNAVELVPATGRALFNLPSTRPGPPSFTYRLSEGVVALWPVPDKEYPLRMLLATAPTLAATDMDTDLGNRWKDAVVGGALARLGLNPGQAYTSVTHATWGASEYRKGVSLARMDRNASFDAELTVTMRPFA